MKKILFTLLSLSLFTSCSSDDSDNTSDSDLNNDDLAIVDSNTSELKNYTITFPSGNSTTHNFDGSNGINSIRNEVLQSSFEYDADGNLGKYIFYQNSGEIDYSYTFNYDETDRIETIDVFEGFSFTKPENYTMTFEYNEDTISTGIPTSLSGDFFNIIEITINEDGTISKILEKDDDYFENEVLVEEGEVDFIEEFTYDSNKNCIAVNRTETNFVNDELTETLLEYRYDNQVNPLYSFYKKNYIPIIIIYLDRFNPFGIRGINTSIEQFGQNAHSGTIYPSSFTDFSRFTYENEYDNNSNLIKNSVTNVASGEITASTTFEY